MREIEFELGVETGSLLNRALRVGEDCADIDKILDAIESNKNGIGFAKFVQVRVYYSRCMVSKQRLAESMCFSL